MIGDDEMEAVSSAGWRGNPVDDNTTAKDFAHVNSLMILSSAFLLMIGQLH